jgi:filamentous hemagglutinin
LTTGVVSLTTGPGLTQNRTTGQILVSANIASLTIQTQNGLTVGVGSPTGTSATITNSVTPLVIGLGSTVSFTTINATTLSGQLSTASQPNITSLGTLVSLNVTGNVTASNFIGNVVGGTISGTIAAPGSNTQILFNNRGNLGAASRITYSGTSLALNGTFTVTNGDVTADMVTARQNAYATYFIGTFLGPATSSGQVSNSSQPNITSVGTLSALQVAGNISSVNLLTANTVSANLLGNVTGNLIGEAARATTVTSAAQPNITSLGTLTILNVNGNASIGNIAATYITGAVITASQPNITSVGNLSALKVDGNANIGNISAVLVSANTVGIHTGNVSGNLSGNVSGDVSGNLSGNVTGNVSGNLSGNVTGAVTGNVSGNINGNSVLANYVTANYFIGNISGNLSIPGNDLQLVFRDGGIANTHTGATYNRTTGLMSITGNVSSGNLTATGIIFATSSANVASIISRGEVNADGNVSGANLVTNGILQVTGNASVGNITARTLSGNIVSVSGNVSGANLVASGVISIQGTSEESLKTSGGANIVGNAFIGGNVLTSNVNVTTRLTTLELVARGNLSGANLSTDGLLQVTSNATIGNISTGIIVSTGTIGGTLASINVGGGIISIGTANVGNVITSNANITGVANVGSLTTPGNVNVTQQIFSTGNINASTAWINAQNANITGNAQFGNLGTPGNINAVTGWVNAANANISGITAGNIYANAGSIGASLMSSNALSVTGTANFSHVVLPNITNIGITSVTYSSTTITVNTVTPHGMAVAGAQITLSGLTSTTNAPNGTWTVATIVSTTSFTFTVTNAPTNTPVGTIVSTSATLSIKPLMTSTGSGVFGGTLSVTGTGSFGNASTTHLTASGDLYANTGLLRSANANITGTAQLLHVTSTGNSAFTGSWMNVTASATFAEVPTAGNITSQANIQAANLVANHTLSGGNLSTQGQLSAGNANIAGNHIVNGIFTANTSANIVGNAAIGNVGTTHVTATGNINTLSGYLKSLNANITGVANVANLETTGNLYANTGLMKTLNSNVTGTLTSLHVESSGNANFTGAVFRVTANANIGNISEVMNIVSTGTISTNGLIRSANANITGIANIASANISGNSSHGNIESLGLLNVRGNANVGNASMMHLVATGNVGVTGVLTTTIANVGNLQFPPATNISGTISVIYASTTITISSTVAHELSVGNEVVLAGITTTDTDKTKLPNGVYVVNSISTTPADGSGKPLTFTVIAAVAPTGTLGGTITVTVRPLITSAGSGIFNGRLKVGGNAEILGTLSGLTNLSVSTLITGATFQANDFNGSNANITGNATFGNIITTLANITGRIIGAGNLTITSTNQSNFSGNVGLPHLFAQGNVEGNILKSSTLISAVGNVSGGNLTTNGILQVTGNASIGNITAINSVTGNIVTISGNVSGGNLVTSGVLSVTGTANLGSLNLPSTLKGISSITSSGTTVTVNTTANHGGSMGTEFTLTGTVAATSGSPNINAGGNPAWFVIATVPTLTSFTFVAAVAPVGTINTSVASLNFRPYIISNGSAQFGGGLTATGNLTAGYIIGNGSTLTSVPAANLVGYAPLANAANTALTAGSAATVTNSSQTTITQVGQLINLVINGNTTQGITLVITTITAGAPSVGQATITYATRTAIPYTTGQSVTIVGVTGTTGYNGAWTVVSSGLSSTVITCGITGVATLSASSQIYNISNVSLTGNLNAAFVAGNGSLLAGLSGANVLGNVSSTTLTYGIALGNYTNITGVGTLNALSVSGDTTISGLANVNGLQINDASGSHINFSSNQGLTAATTPIPTLSKTINIISAASGAAPYNVAMPATSIGRSIFVFNDTEQSINIIPTTGCSMDGYAVNTAFVLGAGARIQFVAGTLTKWYAMTAVYA